MNSYLASVLTYIFIWLICIMGSFLLTGLTGMFSLGQAAMMLMGGYASAIFYKRVHMPVIVACLCAIALCALVAWLMSYFALRMRQDHFSIATLGFSEAVKALINNLSAITGGAVGISGMPLVVKWWMPLIILILVIAFIAHLKKTDFGRRCRAVRDNELAAEVLGIDVFHHKMFAFIISSVIFAIGGCLLSFSQGFLNADLGSWMNSAEWIIIVFVGGRDSLLGTLLTGSILLALPELLRFADQWRGVIYSILVIITLGFRPEGLLSGVNLPAGVSGRRLLRAGSGGKGRDGNA